MRNIIYVYDEIAYYYVELFVIKHIVELSDYWTEQV